MNLNALERITDLCWQVEGGDSQRVPVVMVADGPLLRDMDDEVVEQARQVACLPGIVRASHVLPEGHVGCGFPIGGVAAFDADAGGVVSPSGVGFDIGCGVRCLSTGLEAAEVEAVEQRLANTLFRRIPTGVGSIHRVRLRDAEMDAMLRGGARWAIDRGWGEREDLDRIEERGCMPDARPEAVSGRARRRQQDELGTLGSGNHRLEVQRIAEVFAPEVAHALGLFLDDVVVSIHCGSRGLGHQISADFVREMGAGAQDLACAPIQSELGQRYLGAMRAGINCALANRQILTVRARQVFADILPDADLQLLCDVAYNTCKEEEHRVEGEPRRLFVHRKGAVRAWGPGHPGLATAIRPIGQPIVIHAGFGADSHILVGTRDAVALAWGSVCRSAGRRMSRQQAIRNWQGRGVVEALADRGILVRAAHLRGVAEDAPGAYRDVGAVVDVVERAGLARKVARLEPMICIKG